jgi:hypothetical protein
MAKYTIVGNELDGFNIKVKKYWLLPTTLLKEPKNPKFIWSSPTRRGAQSYINLLNRKTK